MPQIARLILRHVCSNPDAQDSVEGIRVWWVVGGGMEASTAEVAEVLEALVARGFLVKIEHAGLIARFGVNRDRLGEIERELKKSEG